MLFLHVMSCCVCSVHCCVPFTVMLQSAPKPFLHTSVLLVCVFITFTIASIAPAFPAATLLLSGLAQGKGNECVDVVDGVVMCC